MPGQTVIDRPTDPPAPTTFERLRVALVREMDRQVRDAHLGWFDHHDGDDDGVVDGTIQLSPIIRALLTELRRAGPPQIELDGPGGQHGIAPYKWRDLIDAILAQGGGSGGT